MSIILTHPALKCVTLKEAKQPIFSVHEHRELSTPSAQLEYRFIFEELKWMSPKRVRALPPALMLSRVWVVAEILGQVPKPKRQAERLRVTKHKRSLSR